MQILRLGLPYELGFSLAQKSCPSRVVFDQPLIPVQSGEETAARRQTDTYHAFLFWTGIEFPHTILQGF
jgi:hypothetical protein